MALQPDIEMNFEIPTYDPSAFLIEWQNIVQPLIQDIMKSESDWLDSVMVQVLPANIYRWGHSNIPYAHRKVMEYLAKEGFVIQRHPDKVCVARKGIVISMFKHLNIGIPEYSIP